MLDRRTRALGYVPTRRGDGGRFRDEVAALERGCTTLGLDLVGIVTEDGPEDFPQDVDYVVVTEYDRAEGMEEVLGDRVRRSAPLVVLASTAPAAMAARQGGDNA